MLNRISIFFPLMISKYHRQTDQYHLLFSKGHHFFYKINYYKFCIVIFNKSFKSKLICDTHTHTHCSLTKLLSHKTEERYKNCRKLLQKKCNYTIQMPLFTLFAIILFNVLSILKTSCQEYVIILIISVLLQCTTMIINYIYKKK